jgi:hypothetical protein
MRLPFRTPLVLLLLAACTAAENAQAPDAASSAADAATPGAADAGPGPSAPTHRAASIPIGIENVNDSPLSDGSYRALLRFVPDRTITIERMYFGYKLRGAHCWDDGQAGYGAGDGGTLDAALVDIDAATGLPAGVIDGEVVNGCTRHDQAAAELGGDPVLVWVDVHATLEAGRMYGLVVRNAHDDPAHNFFSFNMPLADTGLAGPHARNELDASAPGAILALDPREHVAWSEDGGRSWRYGSENGQYASYMNDHDLAHPATRMPQYGFQLEGGTRFAPQPYYAYSDDCVGCTVAYAHARVARAFDTLGGFIASGDDVGTLTLTNLDSGAQASCTPTRGYGFRTCTLAKPLRVEVGQSYTVHGSGAVEILRLDHPQRVLFPGVGSDDGEWPVYQPVAAPGTNQRDVPSLWAGPLSTYFAD